MLEKEDSERVCKFLNGKLVCSNKVIKGNGDMIILCPQCQSEHQLAEDSLVDQDEKVACQNCEMVIPIIKSQVDDPLPSQVESFESTSYNAGDERTEDKSELFSIGDVSPSEGYFDELPEEAEKNISEGLQAGAMDELQAIGEPSSPADNIGSAQDSKELVSLSAEENLETLGDDPVSSQVESFESTSYNAGDERTEDKSELFSIGDESPSEGHFDELPEEAEKNIPEGLQAGLKDEVPAAKEPSIPGGNIGANQHSEGDEKLRIKEEQGRRARKSPDAGLKGEMIGTPIKTKSAIFKIIVPASILILCFSVFGFLLFTDSSATLKGVIWKYVKFLPEMPPSSCQNTLWHQGQPLCHGLETFRWLCLHPSL